MKPWERQECETERDFALFCIYRDMIPPRRMDLVHAPSGHIALPRAEVYELSRANAWVDRVKAWDDYKDQIVLSETEAVIRRTAADRQLERELISIGLRDLVINQLEKTIRTAMSSDVEITRPRELAALADLQLKYDRLIHEESTEITESKADYSKLSPEEREQMAAFYRKINGVG